MATVTPVHSPTRLAASLFVALSLTATACGGDSPAVTAAPAAGAGGSTVADSDDLATNDDVRLIEVLEVDTGEPTTLADTATGDRPVLLWFWAPH